jgi:hypothetical protein
VWDGFASVPHCRPGQRERHGYPEIESNRTWKDHQDEDGGVTSQLGFRIILEDDDMVRVLDATTGERYLRPLEAQHELKVREQRIRELEAELDRLRKLKNG